MGTLKNTTINDTGYLKLPSGTTEQRPINPSPGYVRWNTTQQFVETYNGSSWTSLPYVAPVLNGSTSILAAPSGNYLYENGFTTTGTYWLNGGSGAYQAYVKMDYGGGWINLNVSNNVYNPLLTNTFGTGGSALLNGGGTGTALLGGGNSTQSQANSFGCPGANGKTRLFLNSTFTTDFNITEVRIKILYVSDNSNVVCGPYWPVSTSSRTIIQGSSIEVNGTCANTPNRYSDLVGTGFTVEWYGPLVTATELFSTWTACGGSFTMQLLEIYAR